MVSVAGEYQGVYSHSIQWNGVIKAQGIGDLRFVSEGVGGLELGG